MRIATDSDAKLVPLRDVRTGFEMTDAARLTNRSPEAIMSIEKGVADRRLAPP